MDQDGVRMEAFGSFTQDRYGYDRHYGVMDQKWHRFASKYNMWAKSHVQGSQCAVDYWRDADGNIGKYKTDGNGAFLTDSATGLPIPTTASDPTGQPYVGTPVGDTTGTAMHRLATDGKTEAECAFTNANGDIVNPGSRCDEFTQKCTIPLRNRTIKTIPWYFGPESDPNLFPSTKFALDSWNVAAKFALQVGQKADADRVGVDSSKFVADEALIRARDTASGADKIPDVFVLCHNPVIETDDAACGKPGLLARVGDIRYNMVNILPNPQTPSPWGIMVDADDPLTGEKISTSVNEWGHVLDIASQGTEDLLRWINGEINDDQIASGAYLKQWVEASKLGTKQYAPGTLSQDEIKSKLASADDTVAKGNGLTGADALLPKPLRIQKAAANLAAFGPSLNSTYEGVRTKLIGTEFETKLVTPEMMQAAGYDPTTPLAGQDKLINRASFLRGQNPGLGKWIRHQREVVMAQRGSCLVEQPEPDALVGMARQASKLYPLPDKTNPDYPALVVKRNAMLHQWIREQFHISVIEHEMGHSMGLRHNFAGSTDSLNYHKQYWQLRTRNNAEKACKDVFTPNTDGTKCVGPRWMDPVTDDEVNGLIWKWGSTTVMDYPGDQTQDMNDLGSYDKAFMRFQYGEVVDVDRDAVDGTDKGKAYVGVLDGFGGIGGYTVGNVHYSNYNDKFKVLGTCDAGDGKDPLTAKCTGFDLAYVPTRDMEQVDKYGAQVTAVRPDLVANFARTKDTNMFGDGKKRIRHPYMFGSDEYADTGNLPIFRFDAGADPYEQMQFITSTYENRYIFDNFRRDRVTFNSAAVMSRVSDRYFDKMQGFVKSFALLLGFASSPESAKADPGDLMPLALASSDAMAAFARVLTRPEPGGYKIGLPAETGMPLSFGTGLDINGQINNPKGDFMVRLGSGEGRYVHNDYDYTQGYWWSSYQKFAGTSYEKLYAAYYVYEGYNHFVANAKEDYIDGRYKNLNFASVFPNQVRRLFTNIMAGDPMTLGPYIADPAGGLTKDGFASVRYLPWEKYDATDPTTIALDYPKNAVVLDPLLGWEQQYQLMFIVGWFGSTTLTNENISQMRIWSPNAKEAVQVPVSEQLRFRDPVSGVVYAAKNYGTETLNTRRAAVQKTIGARMIQFSNELAARAYNQTGTVVDQDGVSYPKYDTDNPKDFAIAKKLTGFVANLEVGRQLTNYLGNGI
jgi:hypothetical protein